TRVGFEALRQDAQQRGLAVAVAADDADAIALGDADGDVVQDGAGREGLADALGDDERGHQINRAPVTGPRDWMTSADDATLASAIETSRPCSSDATRNTVVGPDPEINAPSAPASSPTFSVSASSGRSDREASVR